MTPSFYYVFNIFLSCNINIPSFIGNLWWDLLLGNHLKNDVAIRCSGLTVKRKCWMSFLAHRNTFIAGAAGSVKSFLIKQFLSV